MISRCDLESRDQTWSVLVIGAVLAFPVLRDNPLTVFITVSNVHINTLLQALILFLLADQFLGRGDNWQLGLLLLFGTASVAGDPLAVFIAALPVAGGALLTDRAGTVRVIGPAVRLSRSVPS